MEEIHVPRLTKLPWLFEDLPIHSRYMRIRFVFCPDRIYHLFFVILLMHFHVLRDDSMIELSSRCILDSSNKVKKVLHKFWRIPNNSSS